MNFEIVEALNRLGLTRNQGKILLSLMKHPPLTVHQIAALADLPPELVYRIVPTLQELGLVEKTVTTPIRFQAVSTKTAIGILLKVQERKYIDAKEKAKHVIAELIKKESAPVPKEPVLVLVPLGERLEKVRNEFALRVDKSFDVVTIDMRVSLKMCELYKKCLRRHVKIRVVIEEPKSRAAIVERFKSFCANRNFKFRFHTAQISTIVALNDYKEVLISERTRCGYEDSPVYRSNNSAIVGMAKTYFENLWATSTEWKQPNMSGRYQFN